MDVSHYEPQIYWQTVLGSDINFSFMKASQGTAIDDKFRQFWNESRGVMPRGAYHLFDGRYSVNSPTAQVNTFLAQLGGDLGELPLVLDIEGIYAWGTGAYCNWQSMKAFLQTLISHVGNKEIMIYTNVGSWDNYAPYGSDLDFFTQFGLWVANYGVTSPKIPRGWTGWRFWQYADNGVVNGIPDVKVDLDWFNGTKEEFEARYWYDTTVPNNDIVELWYDNKVTYTKGYRSSPRPFEFHTVRFKKSDLERVNVSDNKYLRTTGYYLTSRGCHIAVNGDEVIPYTQLPKGLGLADGSYYKADSGETNIQWDVDHNILGMSNKKFNAAYNAIGGSNILLENGVVHWSVLDEAPEPDPRTSIFWNANEYCIIMIDGRSNGLPGLGKAELAEFGRSLGMTHGHNLDGGDSSTLCFNVDGQAVVKNRLPDNKQYQRVNHVGFWIKAGTTPPPPPPSGENAMYRVEKQVGLRPTPSMYNSSIKNIPAGTEFESSIVQWVDEFGGIIFVYYEMGTDKGWLPMTYNGVVYVNVVEVPPTYEKPIALELEWPDGSINRYNIEG